MTDQEQKALLEIYKTMDSGRIYEAKVLLEKLLGITQPEVA